MTRERTPISEPLVVEPLDPDSPKGREVAQRLGEVFAEVREEIACRKARAALDEGRPT